MRQMLWLCGLLLVGSVLAKGAGEGVYPSGSITMIVPYSAGGGTDNAARIVAEGLSASLGVQVLVNNRPGAGGQVGAAEIAKSKPDGYTIGVLGGPDNFYATLTGDPEFSDDDFDYMAVYNMSLPVLVARKGTFTSLQQLVDYGKAHPGKITIGVGGGAARVESAITMFYGDYRATLVPFPGSAKVMAALLGGHIDAAILTPSYLPTTDRDGAVPLVYFSQVKSPAYPNIPSPTDFGFDVNLAHNPIFVLPKGVDPDVRTKLVSAFDEVGKDPKIAEKFAAINTVFQYLSGDALTDYLSKVQENMSKVIKKYPDLFE